MQAVEASIYAAGYPTDAAAVLLVEVDGGPDAVEAESRTVIEILRERGAREVRSASTPADRARLWQGRKKAFGAMGRIAPDLAVQDAVVPRSALPDIMDRIEEIRSRHGLSISNVFHAGDGNLHPKSAQFKNQKDSQYPPNGYSRRTNPYASRVSAAVGRGRAHRSSSRC